MMGRTIAAFWVVTSITAAQRLAVKTFTTADGLAHNSVHRILADSRGFVWFGTGEGLSRFDGYGFTSYGAASGLPHPSVYSILETRAGELWIGTGSGLCRIGSGGPMPSATGICASFPLLSGENVEVRALAEGRDGALWAGTSAGLWRAARGAGDRFFQNVRIPSVQFKILGVLSLLEDSFQTLWIATEVGLYRRWPDGRIERYHSAVKNGPGAARTIRGDSQGGLFVGTGRGLFSCKPTPTACSDERFWNRGSGLTGDYVMDVSGVADGGAWVVSLDGVSRIPPPDSNQTRATAYISAVDLGDSPLEAVAEDLEGNVWVGSDGRGASRVARDGLASYTERDGLGSHDVISLFEDADGQLLAVSHSREGLFLNQLKGERFQPIRMNVDRRRISPLWHGHYQAVTSGTQGEWFVVTNFGLARFTSIREVSELSRAKPRYELAQRNLIRLFGDHDGNLWISERYRPESDGLLRWNSKRQAFEWFPPSAGGPDLSRDQVNAYAEDRAGNLWLGTERGGLWRLNSKGFRRLDLPAQFTQGEISWLHTDRAGRLWIASGAAGASRIDRPEDGMSLSARYTTQEGLSSNGVLCITEDLSGQIYLGGARGIDRLDPATGRIKHYTTADGLAFGELQTAFRDRRGWLWFGTQQGLSRLIPTPREARKAPPIAITGISVNGVPVPVSPRGETEASLPDLPPGRDQVQIEFVGLGFRAGEALRYQYLLEDAGNEWTAPATQRTVTYAGLRPGKYRFLVRA
jgi:ligand-binding sensor domain-containing protein